MRRPKRRSDWIATDPKDDPDVAEWSLLLDQQLQNYYSLNHSASKHSYDHLINVPADKSPFLPGIRTDFLATICLKEYRSANIVLEKENICCSHITQNYHRVKTITEFKHPVGRKGWNGKLCYHVLAVYSGRLVTEQGHSEVVTECVTLFPEQNYRFSLGTDSTKICSVEIDKSTKSRISLSKGYPERYGNVVDYKEKEKAYYYVPNDARTF